MATERCDSVRLVTIVPAQKARRECRLVICVAIKFPSFIEDVVVFAAGTIEPEHLDLCRCCAVNVDSDFQSMPPEFDQMKQNKAHTAPMIPMGHHTQAVLMTAAFAMNRNKNSKKK